MEASPTPNPEGASYPRLLTYLPQHSSRTLRSLMAQKSISATEVIQRSMVLLEFISDEQSQGGEFYYTDQEGDHPFDDSHEVIARQDETDLLAGASTIKLAVNIHPGVARFLHAYMATIPPDSLTPPAAQATKRALYLYDKMTRLEEQQQWVHLKGGSHPDHGLEIRLM